MAPSQTWKAARANPVETLPHNEILMTLLVRFLEQHCRYQASIANVSFNGCGVETAMGPLKKLVRDTDPVDNKHLPCINRQVFIRLIDGQSKQLMRFRLR